ncbi:MAG: rod shape-determining protein MreC [Sulfurovum sp.]|nr:MAG: rod shape-determining protein MreC [Sulfurovum sp.]
MKNSKKIFLSLFIIIIIFLLRKEESFQDKFATFTLPIKESYLNISNSIKDAKEQYLYQADSIKQFKNENLLLRKYLYQQKMRIVKLEALHTYNEERFNLHKNILRVQTISYKKLNDFSQIYLTKGSELQKDKIFGLIQKNVAAGIAIKTDEPLKGILLSNEECQFSTFIGEQKRPGIAKGIDAQSMEVNFIPKWSKINIGDKVVTSGLDNIFLPNIPVGVVTKVITRSTYKTAIIKIYADVLHPNFFYLVKKVTHKVEDLNISATTPDNNNTKLK